MRCAEQLAVSSKPLDNFSTGILATSSLLSLVFSIVYRGIVFEMHIESHNGFLFVKYREFCNRLLDAESHCAR